MKNEANFNGIISSSINTKGYAYKIPDTFSSSGMRSIAPFDGFGWCDGKFLCWEAKYLTEPKAFNFKRLENHQIKSLISAYENIKNCESIFIIGVNFGRADKRCFVFKNKDLYYIKDRKEKGESLLKKEFENLPYFKIKKNQIDIEELLK